MDTQQKHQEGLPAAFLRAGPGLRGRSIHSAAQNEGNSRIHLPKAAPIADPQRPDPPHALVKTTTVVPRHQHRWPQRDSCLLGVPSMAEGDPRPAFPSTPANTKVPTGYGGSWYSAQQNNTQARHLQSLHSLAESNQAWYLHQKVNYFWGASTQWRRNTQACSS